MPTSASSTSKTQLDPTACILPTSSAQTARVPAKWTGVIRVKELECLGEAQAAEHRRDSAIFDGFMRRAALRWAELPITSATRRPGEASGASAGCNRLRLRNLRALSLALNLGETEARYRNRSMLRFPPARKSNGTSRVASQMKPAIPPNACMKPTERKELATQWTCPVSPYGN
jgi:hypothetical protein